MPHPPRILVAGGSGVFGRLLARELLCTTPAHLVLAGRDRHRVADACRRLHAPDRAKPLVLDLRDTPALTRAAEGCLAVACTAGPFQSLPRHLPRAAMQAGAHWLDISDDPDWVLPLFADTELASAAGHAQLLVAPGLSTVPAISGLLARWCCERLPGARQARVTLFIGNRNAKGAGAIASALGSSFADPQPVELPMGRRISYRMSSPDTVLLHEELGLDAELRVAFEWPAAHRIMAAAAAFARRSSWEKRRRLARWLSFLSTPFNLCGSESGCLQVELWDSFGNHVTAYVLGTGQRLAILPCALVLEALASGELRQRGLLRPGSWLAPEEWIFRLQARGIEFGSRHG
jgi:hypothetical protein